MFSSSLTKLMSTSNSKLAYERVAQIERTLLQKTSAMNATQNISPEKANEFADLLKIKPSTPLKYNVVNANTNISKGEIQNIVAKLSQKHKIDEKLVMAVIQQESNFNPKAVSKAGAKGLMQLMPPTAKELGVTNPFNPEQNLEGGVKYLSKMITKYRGNIVLGLAAYNAGAGNVDKYNGVPPYKETQKYIKNILANYLS